MDAANSGVNYEQQLTALLKGAAVDEDVRRKQEALLPDSSVGVVTEYVLNFCTNPPQGLVHEQVLGKMAAVRATPYATALVKLCHVGKVSWSTFLNVVSADLALRLKLEAGITWHASACIAGHIDICAEMAVEDCGDWGGLMIMWDGYFTLMREIGIIQQLRIDLMSQDADDVAFHRALDDLVDTLRDAVIMIRVEYAAVITLYHLYGGRVPHEDIHAALMVMRSEMYPEAIDPADMEGLD